MQKSYRILVFAFALSAPVLAQVQPVAPQAAQQKEKKEPKDATGTAVFGLLLVGLIIVGLGYYFIRTSQDAKLSKPTPKANAYGTGSAEGLLANVQQLMSFDQVKEWDTSASSEVAKIKSANESMNGMISALNQEAEKARIAHKAIPVPQSLFASTAPIKKLEAEIKMLQNHISGNQELSSQLEDWIAKTPDNPAQAKEIIKELKVIKKELGVQKKEIATSIRAVNQSARVQNSQIANQYFVKSKYKQIQRIGVRAEREQALRPHETQRQMVEMQVIEVDRMIAWIERIGLSA